MRRPGGYAGSLSISYLLLKYTGSTITQLPCWRKFDLVWIVDCGRVLHRGGGLTTFIELNLGLRPRLVYCAPLALGCGSKSASPGGASSRPSGARTGHPAGRGVSCRRPTLSPKGGDKDGAPGRCSVQRLCAIDSWVSPKVSGLWCLREERGRWSFPDRGGGLRPS
jgi:hypothetical protein